MINGAGSLASLINVSARQNHHHCHKLLGSIYGAARNYINDTPADSALWHECGREKGEPNRAWLFSLPKFVQRFFFQSSYYYNSLQKKKAKLRPQEALTSWSLDYASHVLIYESLRMQRNQPQKHKSPLALILGQTKMPPPHPEKEALAGSLGSLQQSTALWKENPPKALPEQPSACFSHDDLQGTHTLHQRPNGTAAHCHLRSFVS